MSLSTNDLAWVRSQVGNGVPPSDEDLNTAYDRLLDRNLVALEVLEGREAVMDTRPAEFDADGDVSWKFSDKQLELLQARVNRLRNSGTAGTGLLYRKDRER